MNGATLFTQIKILLTSLLVLCILPVFGQKTRHAEGQAQVRVERNMTKEEAQKKAVELAKINAIENIFGTYIEQQTNLTVESGKSDFYIMGFTKVKGIWVRETEKRFTEDYREEKGEFGNEKTLWITCFIKGEVKKITPRPAIEYQIRNCGLPTCRTASFYSGEQLYLWFESPVDGYISVFLNDGNMVYRLLPYSNSKNSNSFKIKSDQEYLFFSKDMAKDLPVGEVPDEIELFTLKNKENNSVVIVFSTNDFFKPGLNYESVDNNKYLLPKSLSVNRFEEWLSELRTQLDDFIDIETPIEILLRK